MTLLVTKTRCALSIELKMWLLNTLLVNRGTGLGDFVLLLKNAAAQPWWCRIAKIANCTQQQAHKLKVIAAVAKKSA
jgi:hypothetical protein